jgi:hypothetical protein
MSSQTSNSTARRPHGHVGIIEQRFDGAHLDQKRRKAAEIGMNGRREGGLRRLTGKIEASEAQDPILGY